MTTLSYLFGSVIVGMSMNIVASLRIGEAPAGAMKFSAGVKP
jgi:hypothetical protein